jgi:hypothetical protein
VSSWHRRHLFATASHRRRECKCAERPAGQCVGKLASGRRCTTKVFGRREGRSPRVTRAPPAFDPLETALCHDVSRRLITSPATVIRRPLPRWAASYHLMPRTRGTVETIAPAWVRAITLCYNSLRHVTIQAIPGIPDTETIWIPADSSLGRVSGVAMRLGRPMSLALTAMDLRNFYRGGDETCASVMLARALPHRVAPRTYAMEGCRRCSRSRGRSVGPAVRSSGCRVRQRPRSLPSTRRLAGSGRHLRIEKANRPAQRGSGR